MRLDLGLKTVDKLSACVNPVFMLATPVAEALESQRVTSLTSIVQQELERLILSGELTAGQRLNEHALAAQLGVSRGPIREAARGLEKAGLVRRIAHRGAFVREISVGEAEDLYDLRAALFGLACQRVAEAANPAHHDALGRLVAQMAAVQRRGDTAAYYPLNLEFHDCVIRFAGSARLEATYASLVKEMHLFRRRALSSVTNLGESNAEHEAILASIVAGRAAEARRRGELHVIAGKRRFLAVLKHKDPARPP